MSTTTFDELVATYLARGATRAEAEQAAAFALEGGDDRDAQVDDRDA